MKKTKIIEIKSKLLTSKQIDRMYSIMQKYYDNMDRKIFEKDLNNKEVTFLLIDNNEKIQGFTSILIYEKKINNQKVAGVFSGDTIVEKDFRGSFDLPFAWLKYVYSKKKNYDKTFWFMLSKGYRTYRLLPRFFKKHYPNYKEKIPKDIESILNEFAYDKFGRAYNSETNIFIPSYNYFLKSGREDIDPKLLKDPHIKFFKERNPNFWKGYELVNYADFDENNLTFYGLIFVKLGDYSLVRFLSTLFKKVSKIIK